METKLTGEEKVMENTHDMMAFLDSRRAQAQNIVDDYLKVLTDPEKIKSATLSEISIALGIVADKFM